MLQTFFFLVSNHYARRAHNILKFILIKIQSTFLYTIEGAMKRKHPTILKSQGLVECINAYTSIPFFFSLIA